MHGRCLSLCPFLNVGRTVKEDNLVEGNSSDLIGFKRETEHSKFAVQAVNTLFHEWKGSFSDIMFIHNFT